MKYLVIMNPEYIYKLVRFKGISHSGINNTLILKMVETWAWKLTHLWIAFHQPDPLYQR